MYWWVWLVEDIDGSNMAANSLKTLVNILLLKWAKSYRHSALKMQICYTKTSFGWTSCFLTAGLLYKMHVWPRVLDLKCWLVCYIKFLFIITMKVVTEISTTTIVITHVDFRIIKQPEELWLIWGERAGEGVVLPRTTINVISEN